MNTLIAIALGVWKKANCWVLQLERTTLNMERKTIEQNQTMIGTTKMKI